MWPVCLNYDRPPKDRDPRGKRQGPHLHLEQRRGSLVSSPALEASAGHPKKVLTEHQPPPPGRACHHFFKTSCSLPRGQTERTHAPTRTHAGWSGTLRSFSGLGSKPEPQMWGLARLHRCWSASDDPSTTRLCRNETARGTLLGTHPGPMGICLGAVLRARTCPLWVEDPGWLLGPRKSTGLLSCNDSES